ncbi:MAG: hypothetical protein EBS82_05460, partial [Methylocystaceae bacterium]|nr:hypothetical protein [Methylocystaceae bacterium]
MNQVDKDFKKNASVFTPLTLAREGIHIANLLDPLQNVYNLAHYREISGAINADLLSKAIERVLSLSPAYRSIIKIDNGTPILETRQAFSSELAVVDFSSHPDPEGSSLALMNRERLKTFNLFEGPLFRWMLIKLSTEHYYVFTCVHHIIVDGTSWFKFERNVFDVYFALSNGEAAEKLESPDLALEAERLYLDSEQYFEDQRFWNAELADLEPQISLSGKPAASVLSFYRAAAVLSPDRIAGLNDFCERNKLKFKHALIALSALYYARMTNQSDFVIEIPVSLRKTCEDRVAIDMRSSGVFLRINTAPCTSLGEFLQIFKSKFQLALRHQRYPREKVLRDLGCASNISCFVINIMPDRNISIATDIRVKTHNLSNGPVQDVNVNIYGVDNGEEILVELDCNSLLYNQIDSSQQLNRLLVFIDAVVASSTVDSLTRPSLISDDERQLVLNSFNDTQKDIPNTTLPELFAAQVEKTPEGIALIFGEEEVSYRELDARANQLTRYLIAEGIGPEDIVAIALDRSIEMVVSLLGVLKSGAAYLPLDPEYPVERLQFMLADSNAKRLITTHEIYARLLGEADSAQTVSSHPGREAFHTVLSVTAFLLDDDVLQAELATCSFAPISDNERVQPLTSDNLAYVIYTSGTTGRPKGVSNTHASTVNLVGAQIEGFCINQHSRILQFASFAFDACVSEVMTALLSSGVLVLPDSVGSRLNLEQINYCCQKHQVTHATLPPVFLRSVAVNCLNNFETIIVAGEACPSSLVARFANSRRFLNAYG